MEHALCRLATLGLLRDAGVDGEAGVAHVSLLTRVNVCAAGRRRGDVKMLFLFYFHVVLHPAMEVLILKTINQAQN